MRRRNSSCADTHHPSSGRVRPHRSARSGCAPIALEEGVEVRDVEVDHLTKGASVILKIDFEPQMRGPEAVLERPRVVRPAVDESEVRESLQELRGRRDVNVKRPCDLAGQMPAPVSQGPQDCDAVFAREKEDCLTERLLVHSVGLERERAGRREVYSSWSRELLRDVPGFSGPIIVPHNRCRTDEPESGNQPAPANRGGVERSATPPPNLATEQG